jgi:hypothetical protein
VFPADDPRLGPQADLLRILQLQRVEISRATAPFTVSVPVKKRPARPAGADDAPAPPPAPPADKTEPRTFRGPPIVRMDQLFSCIATRCSIPALGTRRSQRQP